jgi:hypothetical protein
MFEATHTKNLSLSLSLDFFLVEEITTSWTTTND